MFQVFRNRAVQFFAVFILIVLSTDISSAQDKNEDGILSDDVSAGVNDTYDDMDKCVAPLDSGTWCEPLKFLYFYDLTDNRCKPFHYSGCGKSTNRFDNIEDCEAECKELEELKASETTNGPVGLTEIDGNASDKSYLKSDEVRLSENKCLGFYYNISQEDLRLFTYFCDVEAGGHCVLEVFDFTDGEEKCKKFRSWHRGTHAYSVYFTLPTPKSDNGNQTVVSISDVVKDEAAFVNTCQNACKVEL